MPEKINKSDTEGMLKETYEKIEAGAEKTAEKIQEIPERTKDKLKFLADLIKKNHQEALARGEKIYRSLSDEERVDLMTYIFKVLHNHLKDPTTYRGLLYGSFGLPMESYALCQLSGALEIHNVLVDASERGKTIEDESPENDEDERE